MPVHVIDHPLIRDALAHIRSKDTRPEDLRPHVDRVAGMLVYEALRDLPTVAVPVQTPVEAATAQALAPEVRIAVVPILRAGLAMLEATLKCVPHAKVWHLGAYRDPETLKPVSYYNQLPSTFEGERVLMLDGMIATGGTIVAALQLVRQKRPLGVKLVTLLAAQEGIDNVLAAHPQVDVYLAAIDPELTHTRPAGVVVPGLGELSDRLYGTE
jgi:uracil phosphoribosyltransferase